MRTDAEKRAVVELARTLRAWAASVGLDAGEMAGQFYRLAELAPERRCRREFRYLAERFENLERSCSRLRDVADEALGALGDGREED